MSSSRRRESLGVALGAVLTLSGLGFGCGNKEAPQPPPLMIPAGTRDLAIQQRGSELILTFTYPTATIGGFSLGMLEAVEIWEQIKDLAEPPMDELEEGLEAEEGGEPEDEPFDDLFEDEPGADKGPKELTDAQKARVDPFEFAAEAKIKLTLTGEELLSTVIGESIAIRLPMDEPQEDAEEAYVFGVKTISLRGLGSKMSNLAVMIRRETPPAPTPFEVTAGPTGIELDWGVLEADKVVEEQEDETEGVVAAVPDEVGEDGIRGYRVYRRDATVRDYGSPLRELPASIDFHRDSTAVIGNRYIYAVTAVIETKPVVETGLSVEREVDYQDRFAPAPPGNLIALVERSSVRLLWDASRGADDLLGYFILRAVGDGEFEQVNEDPIEVLEYTDTDVRSGVLYRYRVEAIDQTGNRGESGQEI